MPKFLRSLFLITAINYFVHHSVISQFSLYCKLRRSYLLFSGQSIT
jgi:hypothetical protein